MSESKFIVDSDQAIVTSEYGRKLQALAELVEAQQIARLHVDDLACQTNIDCAKTKIKLGKKYDKIDIGGSGMLMVERETGIVYGIKAYGVIHKGHKYGTLDTTNKWFWGYYYPMPGEERVRIKVRA
jgi:hypothetical protein